ILGATSLDWLAITHSLKEWLLLSQPPSCLSKITSFAILSRHFGALAADLGSFPLAAGHYRSATVSRQHHTGIRSLVGGGEPIRPPNPSSALPPADSFPEAIPKYVSGRTSYLRA